MVIPALLALDSQRLEPLLVEILGPHYVPTWLFNIHQKERGRLPTLTESIIIFYVLGFIWQEAREFWAEGLVKYSADLWNVVDILTNFLYLNWILLRILSYIQVFYEDNYSVTINIEDISNYDGEMASTDRIKKPREDWDPYDPILLSEAMFSAGNIFSFLKLVHIFSVHPHLGPLQISLGRMVFDILKFFFIYTWVVFAFGCGINQLLWYYSNRDYERCFNSEPDSISALDLDHSCAVWRRFSNMFETSQTLFWASFGLIDLLNFELSGIKEFTRFWGLLMFGSYSIINVVVLLNLLIAMMSDSYQVISAGRDTEWKFARSKLWINYFDDSNGHTVPPPFNLIPVPSFLSKCCKRKRKIHPALSMPKVSPQIIYEHVMKSLVRRYVTREQRKIEETGAVTEDDVNEIKQDIASFRFELIDLLKTNGMKATSGSGGKDSSGGKIIMSFSHTSPPSSPSKSF